MGEIMIHNRLKKATDKELIAQFIDVVYADLPILGEKEMVTSELIRRYEIMIGVQIKDGFIDFAKTDFKCPSCKKEYNDGDDKYLEKCERNKNGCTKIKCECGKPFHMTYNFMGDTVSFL
jgi:hypothetical protein